MLTPDRKPWLFLKRINSWNPWGSMKHVLVPRPGHGEPEDKESPALVRSRWI